MYTYKARDITKINIKTRKKNRISIKQRRIVQNKRTIERSVYIHRYDQ